MGTSLFTQNRFFYTVMCIAITFSIAKFEGGLFVSKIMLSDFIVPVLFSILLFTKEFRSYVSSLVADLNFRKVAICYIILLVVMMFSAVNAYIALGYFPNYAIHNRITGFTVMGMYFLLTMYFLSKLDIGMFFEKYVRFFVFYNVILVIAYLFFGNLYYLLDMKCFSGFSRNSTSNSFFVFFLLIGIIAFGDQIKNNLNESALFKYYYVVFFLFFICLASNSRIMFFILPIFFLTFIYFSRTKVSLMIAITASVIAWSAYREWNSPVLIRFLIDFLDILISYLPSKYSSFFSIIKNYDIKGLILISQGETRSFALIDDSSTIRLNMYSKAISYFFEAPLFGKGLGYFITSNNFGSEGNLVAHNTLLWIASEMGVIGLAAFVLLMYNIFVPAVIMFRYDKTNLACILLGLYTFFAYSLFHEVFYQRVFWIFLASVCYLYTKGSKFISAQI